MITDALTLFSNNQTVTGTNTTVVGTDKIDLGVARDPFSGEDLTAAFTVGTAFAGATSVDCQVVQSANSDLSSGTVVGATGPILLAALTANARFAVTPKRLNETSLGRYLGVQYVIVGSGSAGTMRAELVKDYDDRAYYSSGFSVS